MHSGDSASNHSKDEDTAEITFKPQVSYISNVLEGEGTPAGIEEVQDIKGNFTREIGMSQRQIR
jgi:hypothetical protein